MRARLIQRVKALILTPATMRRIPANRAADSRSPNKTVDAIGINTKLSAMPQRPRFHNELVQHHKTKRCREVDGVFHA